MPTADRVDALREIARRLITGTTEERDVARDEALACTDPIDLLVLLHLTTRLAAELRRERTTTTTTTPRKRTHATG